MSEASTFDDFVRRIRAGDDQAAAELVRLYEPLIRREVRLHLEDRRLRRVLDSMDVCQSVLASFFVRTSAGQYDFDNPEQLVKLLVTMARNKVVSAARHQLRQRRTSHRLVETGETVSMDAVADHGPGPSDVVANTELLSRMRKSLSADELQIVELRGDGLRWSEIANRLGGTAQARRMQLSRALDRVALELGVDRIDDE